MKLLRYGMPGKEKPGLLDQNGILRDLATRPSISWLEWNDAHSVKKELRKLGVTDPPGTIIHKGRRFWKDLELPEKMNVAGEYLNMQGDKELEAQKEELEKTKMIIEKTFNLIIYSSLELKAKKEL